MIWIIFGAIAVATFLSVGRIVVDADPERARKPVRLASFAFWLLGILLCFTGKPLFGLPLMALGALGIGALSGPWGRPRSRSAEGDRRRGASARRPHVERDPDPRAGWRDLGGRRGVMTEEEAYQVLGVQPGASPEEIVRAHRALMKKVHPDQGGSTELAARVNAAKDILTARRHG